MITDDKNITEFNLKYIDLREKYAEIIYNAIDTARDLAVELTTKVVSEELLNLIDENNKLKKWIKVQTKLFTLNDIIDLPKRFSTKFTYNYKCFNKANNYKQNLIRNFANGNSEFEKLEKSLYNFLLTIDLSNDCCEFDKYFHMIDKSLSWNDNKLKLFKINNFITNEIKIGILHILLNEGKITI